MTYDIQIRCYVDTDNVEKGRQMCKEYFEDLIENNKNLKIKVDNHIRPYCPDNVGNSWD